MRDGENRRVGRQDLLDILLVVQHMLIKLLELRANREDCIMEGLMWRDKADKVLNFWVESLNFLSSGLVIYFKLALQS